MKAYEWTQDAEGRTGTRRPARSSSSPADDPGAEGREDPAGGDPGPRRCRRRRRSASSSRRDPRAPEGGGGVNVAVAIRFGVPIFVKPLKEEARGGRCDDDVRRCAPRAREQHGERPLRRPVRPRAGEKRGGQRSSRELSGGTSLPGSPAGTRRPPPGRAERWRSSRREVKTDKLPLRGRMVVDRSMCGP